MNFWNFVCLCVFFYFILFTRACTPHKIEKEFWSFYFLLTCFLVFFIFYFFIGVSWLIFLLISLILNSTKCKPTHLYINLLNLFIALHLPINVRFTIYIYIKQIHILLYIFTTKNLNLEPRFNFAISLILKTLNFFWPKKTSRLNMRLSKKII